MVCGGIGCYVSIGLSRTFRKRRLGAKPYKNVILRVDGGMRRHLLIVLGNHSEREDFCGLLGVFKCMPIY